MSKNFNDIYPTVQAVVDDMHEVITNVCETKAERKVLIRRMDEYVVSGMDKIDLYNAMTKEINIHNKIDKEYNENTINRSSD